MKDQLDILIIGSGPGGYVAAIAAAQKGKTVGIVEKKHLGGVCLNWGCIPTKALLRAAEVHHTIMHAADFGIKAKLQKVHWGDVIKRSRDVSAQLSGGISHLMKKNKIKVFEGHGRLDGKEGDLFKVDVSGEKVYAKKVILATGARARSLPGFDIGNDHIWTAHDAMIPNEQPTSLLIVGSGAIGVEFASFYNQMGTEVTLVEMQPTILPQEDTDISSIAHKLFEKQGISIHTNTTASIADIGRKGVEINFSTKANVESKTFDKVLLAVGILPNTEDLGLDKTKVTLTKGHVNVDAQLQTAEPGLYAIGDITGPPWLAHKASHEGVLAAAHACGETPRHTMNRNNIPGCTYSHPQIASIGFTEHQARTAGHKVKIGRFPGIGNGKAIAYGDPTGMVKVIFDEKTGELLGAHMIGPEVTEQIQGFAMAKTLEATEEEIMQTIFPHPTLSEMMHEATLDAFGKAIHI